MPSLQQRMLIAFPEPHPRGLKAEIARVCEVQPPSVTSWFKNPEKVESIDRTCAERLIAHYKLKLSARWLAEGVGDMLASGANLVIPAMTIQAGNVVPITKISVRDAVMALGQALAGRDAEMELTPASSLLKTLALQPDRASEVADRLEGLLGGGDAERPVFSRKTR